MPIPPDALAAKAILEASLLHTGFVTGIDYGVRDETEPNPNDLVLRIFVADKNSIPPAVSAAAALSPIPVVILQRTFTVTGLPDNNRYRPVQGGVTIAASRFVASGSIHVGTLGAVVTDKANPSVKYGLSNWHVLCVDMGRNAGDEMVQPAPSILGVLPGDRLGTLVRWKFPETTEGGEIDAAICTLEGDGLKQVIDIGNVGGFVPAKPGMMVTKRGRTTGRTFGWISGIGGCYPLDFPQLPPVTTAPGVTTIQRIQRNQIQIRVDFPQSIVFGEHGDSGSVVVGDGNRVVGLYWGSGYASPGDPMSFGLATPAETVQDQLQIAF